MDVSISQIKPNQKKAIFLAKRELASLVCDAVNLEGINYTLPEVQTLLDGVTVGGHKLSEQQITLNQANAWRSLFESISLDRFGLTKSFACELHAIAAFEEALEWGTFRQGEVTIAGTTYQPPSFKQLDSAWTKLFEQAEKLEDIYERSIFIFLQMARNQFFYDVNKRMGRFMMNGLLLSKGYPVINLPASRQLEFNQLMLTFYPSNDVTDMTSFMMSCLSPEIIKIMAE